MPGGQTLLSRRRAGAHGPSASTRVVAVIGDPVLHSLSPAIHNAAFDALGLDWVYVALRVQIDATRRAVEGVRVFGLEGLSVTMPHKAAVCAVVDSLSAVAARLGASNTVVRRGSTLVGENTDGAGFVDALTLDQGWDPDGRRCVVLGTGGAAGALSLALAEAGAAEVAVVGRNFDSASKVALLAGARGRVASVEQVRDFDLVVNATPVGMAGRTGRSKNIAPMPFELDANRLGQGQLVVDLIYAPAVTPLLEAASSRGAKVANGTGMLLHQASRQFRLWTGEEAPMQAMSDGLVAALADKDT